ncbi:peptidylglycine alpha-hydroxylating monooxygenase-like [Ornithodoros turicata]|uniref:peptidylglycine alpha-hydroxylating monooxygenase-like n=1 Tax=Ornithodoros turicata TaxID=34597 RepID=UPI0031386D41
MELHRKVCYLLSLIFVFLPTNVFSAIPNNEVHKFPLLMPHVQPKQNETYLCTGFHLPVKEHQYIVAFEPNATMHTAHHILIYGCTSPGYSERDTPRAIWNCGEMAGSTAHYVTGPVCRSGSQIIYAWARDAPALTLPDKVGFKIGGRSGIKYLVLQVHYADTSSFQDGTKTDASGIVLSLLPSKTKKVTRRAGVYLLGTGGMIPPKETVHMETACRIQEDFTLFPFAFRTHTHKLGKVVTGYVIRDGQWINIGRRDPLKPQMFFPANKGIKIKKGDVLAARCTMYNFRDRTTYVGSTGNDEMCNFYIMYYVDGDKIPSGNTCFSSGPPLYYWNADRDVAPVPEDIERDASSLI